MLCNMSIILDEEICRHPERFSVGFTSAREQLCRKLLLLLRIVGYPLMIPVFCNAVACLLCVCVCLGVCVSVCVTYKVWWAPLPQAREEVLEG